MSTICTTSSVSASVTRWPSTNSVSLPSLRQEVADLRPTTVHDHGLEPDGPQQHDVRRERVGQGLVDHGVAAELDPTTVLPAKAWMYGRAS
jgi:hypothetical protein